jgi:Cd2+/Zn2+-exporting ATPase
MSHSHAESGNTHRHHHGDGHAHAHDARHIDPPAQVLAIAAELVGYFAPDTQIWKGAGLAVAAAAIWLAGFDVYKKGLTALLRGRLNINALMTVAVTGAFVIGQWPEAAMVMALYAIAEAIEARAVDRARNAIKGLLEMAPEEAAVRQADGTWVTQPVATVALGRRAAGAAGRAGADGRRRDRRQHQHQPGAGHRREHPGGQGVGDPVFAGTINDTGSFEFEVTALASNSTLARIIHAVEEAQGTRAPTQGFVDRFAAVYTPAVFVDRAGGGLLGPGCWTGPGCNPSTRRWCCWSSPAPARW